MLTFFLFNVGVIALVRPLEIARPTLTFYLPVAFVTTVGLSLFLLTRRAPRWLGIVLILVYVAFAVGGYVLFGAAPTQG